MKTANSGCIPGRDLPWNCAVPETQIIEATEEDMKDALREAVTLLKAGEVVALPTETVYGLAADATNADAAAKVFEAKERPSFDPLLVHIGGRNDLETVAKIPDDIRDVVMALADEFWPGPLTMILPKQEIIPDIVTSGLPTVGVRQSANPIFRKINKELGNPIAAPSANRFGRISPTSASAVEKELGLRIPLIVNGGACRDGLESTIISIEPREGKKPIFGLHRAGPITKEMLQKFGKVEKVKPNTDNLPQAPGDLPSHYAPVTPLRILENPEDFNPEEGKNYALLCYKGGEDDPFVCRHDWAVVEALSPGNGKLAEAAVRLFFAMRMLDEAGVDEIIVQPVSEKGLGVAIMDRLRRAAHRD